MGDDGEVNFEIINAINDSWHTVKKIPNHVDIAGELLFRKVFELAPPALGMFSFGPEFKDNEEALYKSPKFKAHARGVVKTLDAAVNMLGPDLEPVTKALTDLGALHVNYGVLPAHYPIVGQALIHTLATALGDKWTPLVKKGWTMIFGFVSTAMIAGASRHLQKQERRKQRIAGRTRRKVQEESKADGEADVEKNITSEVILDVVGIKPTAPSKKMKELTEILNDLEIEFNAEDVEDDLSLSSHESNPAQEVNYSRMVESVYTTWNQIKKIPNHAEVAGVLLFKNIFEIAPGAKALFPFAEQFGDDDEALFKDPTFLKHAVGVVRMLDLAVNMLGPDLEPVTEALEDLGARHCQYGVIADHYPIVGQALLKTLEAALGDKWTKTVEEGWTGIYGFVCISMQRGAENFLEDEMDAMHDL